MGIRELDVLARNALGQDYVTEVSDLRRVITVLEPGSKYWVVAFIADGNTVHIGFNEATLTDKREAAINRLAMQYHAAGLKVTGVQVKPYGFH